MEKLQAALSKAREARVQTTGEATETRPKRSSRPANRQKTSENWEALTPFEPSEKRLKRHRVVTRSPNEAATPFDVLRTKIWLQMRQNGWKKLAITSPTPNSGKTTTACNLALGFGRQQDLRSVLLDLDLRDPSVHEFFDHTPRHGIGDLLTGRVEFKEQALRIGENVAVSMARAPEQDPARLLLSEETGEVIDEIENAYQPDLMIFDLPSVLVNDDTRAFLKNVDCALIVIRAGTTRYRQFDTCEREVAEHTNVAGVVLNAYTSSSTYNDT
jgi:protein-tyrosine kinase